MELVGRGGGGRRRGSSSPERARGVGFDLAEREREEQQQQQGGRRVVARCALVRKVEIVYYLSRNGQLEHPHFMELSQLPNQQLILRDVMEKLSVLRGRGMPSLFSWSCKRSYKNGYVWNDLSENDIIYPAHGAEYVLKGSEIISGCTSDRLQSLPLSNRRIKPLSTMVVEPEEEDEDEEEEEEEIEKDASNSSHCSHGVSREDMVVVSKASKVAQTEIAVEDGSPALSSSSSDPAAAPEPAASVLTRNSVFLQLIACGSAAAAKGGRKSGSLHAGVVTRVAASRARLDEDHEFGDLKGVEGKEYFSGSVAEIIRKPAEGFEPKLQKSSSFDEQRSSKLGLGERKVHGKEREGVKGKCILRAKIVGSSLKLLPQQTQK